MSKGQGVLCSWLCFLFSEFTYCCALKSVSVSVCVLCKCVCQCISALNELVSPVSVVAVAFHAVSGI